MDIQMLNLIMNTNGCLLIYIESTVFTLGKYYQTLWASIPQFSYLFINLFILMSSEKIKALIKHIFYFCI